MSQESQLRIVVDPAPSDREMAAITAAVLTLTPNPPEPDEKPRQNEWREAGKREALRDNHRE